MLVILVFSLALGGFLFWLARYTKTPKWLLWSLLVFGLLGSTHVPLQGGDDDGSQTYGKIIACSILLGVALGMYLRRKTEPPAPTGDYKKQK
jgi:hypothetical protein